MPRLLGLEISPRMVTTVDQPRMGPRAYPMDLKITKAGRVFPTPKNERPIAVPIKVLHNTGLRPQRSAAMLPGIRAAKLKQDATVSFKVRVSWGFKNVN